MAKAIFVDGGGILYDSQRTCCKLFFQKGVEGYIVGVLMSMYRYATRD